MSPNCSMISSEKQNQTSKSSTSQQSPGQKVFTCLLLHFSSIFSGLEEAGVKGIRYHSSTCPQPEAKAPPPRGSPFTLRLRFTLHLYRFVDTPRLTDCVDGGREVRDGFSPGKFFLGLGFGYFQLQVQLQMRRKSCFQIGDSEILNKNGLKQLLKNCKKPNVERATRTILTQISSCCSDLHY